MEKFRLTIEEKLKDFLGLERWEKIKRENFPEKETQELSPDYIDFLIKKYKCKYPQGNEQKEVERVRL
jgi:hypothetical protein